MKKAQSPLIVALILLIAALTLIWGLGIFKDVGKSTEKAEMRNFATSLERALHQQAPKYDGMNEISLALPRSVEGVCFTDRTKEFNEFADLQLSKSKNNFPDNNLFLAPYEDFVSFNIDDLLLEESPLCVHNKEGVVVLTLTGKGEGTLIQAAGNKPDCTQVLYHGSPDEKIDVVFLKNGYESNEDFEADVNDYINVVFQQIAPFSSNLDKFNFYRIDNQEVECESSSFIRCDSFRVKEIASNCPNDYLLVLADRGKIKDSLLPLRSSSISNLASINTADNKLVLIHEFGHTFADLADEYVDDSYYGSFDVAVFPNCDFPGCEDWKNITDGCFPGCSVNQFHRATEKSIMRNYMKSEEFGILNEKVIKESINLYE